MAIALPEETKEQKEREKERKRETKRQLYERGRGGPQPGRQGLKHMPKVSSTGKSDSDAQRFGQGRTGCAQLCQAKPTECLGKCPRGVSEWTFCSSSEQVKGERGDRGKWEQGQTSTNQDVSHKNT